MPVVILEIGKNHVTSSWELQRSCFQRQKDTQNHRDFIFIVANILRGSDRDSRACVVKISSYREYVERGYRNPASSGPPEATGPTDVVADWLLIGQCPTCRSTVKTPVISPPHKEFMSHEDIDVPPLLRRLRCCRCGHIEVACSRQYALSLLPPRPIALHSCLHNPRSNSIIYTPRLTVLIASICL